ncbi:hypothetical protein F0562_012487 [Nyssa sinensis]|uniref:Uncharacterized protein n=1 Tax=Nyssa sinensis TaxID=561372 RepID=A0A5J4ZV92_9ASTE|nr:hypothetical protein F0562_012487 [Nyssa sinensis]
MKNGHEKTWKKIRRATVFPVTGAGQVTGEDDLKIGRQGRGELGLSCLKDLGLLCFKTVLGRFRDCTICELQYSFRNCLPWQGRKAATKKQKYDKIWEKKLSTPIEDMIWIMYLTGPF